MTSLLSLVSDVLHINTLILRIPAKQLTIEATITNINNLKSLHIPIYTPKSESKKLHIYFTVPSFLTQIKRRQKQNPKEDHLSWKKTERSDEFTVLTEQNRVPFHRGRKPKAKRKICGIPGLLFTWSREETIVLGRKTGRRSWRREGRAWRPPPMESLLLCAASPSPAEESETTETLRVRRSWRGSGRAAEAGEGRPWGPSSDCPLGTPWRARSWGTMRTPERGTEWAGRRRGGEAEQAGSSRPFDSDSGCN